MSVTLDAYLRTRFVANTRQPGTNGGGLEAEHRADADARECALAESATHQRREQPGQPGGEVRLPGKRELAHELHEDRLMLQEDVDAYIADAEASNVLK